MLIDFANKRSTDENNKRCDPPALLLRPVTRSCLSHNPDEDYCTCASDFFYFRYAAKYQGRSRYKIDTLSVPAAAITETNLDADAWAIRQEARYRLRQGSGILVFSRPERPRDWFEEAGPSMESRADCFVDAGKLVPAFDLAADGVEFFVHSPHVLRTNY